MSAPKQPPIITDEDLASVTPLRDGDSLLFTTLVGILPHLDESGLPCVVLHVAGLGRFAMPAHYAHLVGAEVSRAATHVEGMSALKMIGDMNGWPDSRTATMIDNFNTATDVVRKEMQTEAPIATRDTVVPNAKNVKTSIGTD